MWKKRNNKKLVRSFFRAVIFISITIQKSFMKKILLPIILIVGFAFQSCNHSSNGAYNKGEAIDAAKELDKKYIASLNAEDLDGVMSCYWKDSNLFVYPPGSEDVHFVSWDSLRFTFKRYFESVEGSKNELINVRHKISGDLVIEWGKRRNTLYGTNPKYPPMILENQYIAVIGNRNGQWVYIIDHSGGIQQLSPTEYIK